jgi:hypothetical protein
VGWIGLLAIVAYPDLMLFIAEPLFLHRWLMARAKVRLETTFRLVHWLYNLFDVQRHLISRVTIHRFRTTAHYTCNDATAAR